MSPDPHVPRARSRASLRACVIVARRILIGMAGGLVLVLGLAMIVLPGPAIVVVPLGLAILATEFMWARRMVERLQRTTSAAAERVRGRRKK